MIVRVPDQGVLRLRVRSRGAVRVSVRAAGDLVTQRRLVPGTDPGAGFPGQQPSPMIELRVTRVSSTQDLVIEVEDNGPGIPDAIASKVFQRFYTTKEAGKGTGLGLAMCLEWTESWGGTLTAGSGAELGGALFTLTLPYIESSEDDA